MLNAFPSIEAFDRINNYQAYMREKNPSEYDPVIHVRPKIKLHGVNAAFGVGPKGIWAQSRDTVLSPENHLYRAYDTLMPFAQMLADIHASAVEAGWTLTVLASGPGQAFRKRTPSRGSLRRCFSRSWSRLIPRTSDLRLRIVAQSVARLGRTRIRPRFRRSSASKHDR